VILVDANLLVYARVMSMPQHVAARVWLEARMNGSARVGLPWPSLLAFVRLVSNPRVFDRPDTVQAAWRQVEEWLDCSCAWIPEPGERHRETLATFLRNVVDRPKLVADAHLAALAVEHGLTLCSTDGDFARFPGLRWENPLQTPPLS
jgi:toxin-antitoxin system PIN domain toxin